MPHLYLNYHNHHVGGLLRLLHTPRHHVRGRTLPQLTTLSRNVVSMPRCDICDDAGPTDTVFTATTATISIRVSTRRRTFSFRDPRHWHRTQDVCWTVHSLMRHRSSALSNAFPQPLAAVQVSEAGSNSIQTLFPRQVWVLCRSSGRSPYLGALTRITDLHAKGVTAVFIITYISPSPRERMKTTERVLSGLDLSRLRSISHSGSADTCCIPPSQSSGERSTAAILFVHRCSRLVWLVVDRTATTLFCVCHGAPACSPQKFKS
ncbi:hypothetical protein KC349_g11 [Hortaea werneckii]|nr:hypothetical protein KC349_g11 [Hortaea werneckii]